MKPVEIVLRRREGECKYVSPVQLLHANKKRVVYT
jgi:hypothetical protein